MSDEVTVVIREEAYDVTNRMAKAFEKDSKTLLELLDGGEMPTQDQFRIILLNMNLFADLTLKMVRGRKN